MIIELRPEHREIAEQTMKLMLEKSFRCGDGNGKEFTHSINCRCKEIDRELRILRKRLLKEMKDNAEKLPN